MTKIIVMGVCSDDPDAYVGKDVQLGRSVEWQISDGLPGQRSSSEDFVDPVDVMNAVIESGTPATFISAQEAAVFLRDLILRLGGVELAKLDITPDAPFYSPVLIINDMAPEVAVAMVGDALTEAGISGCQPYAEFLMNALTGSGEDHRVERGDLEEVVGHFSAVPPEDLETFREKFEAALAPHLPDAEHSLSM